MPSLYQQPDGTWHPAAPLRPRGLLARTEMWLRRHGRASLLASLLGRLDERGIR